MAPGSPVHSLSPPAHQGCVPSCTASRSQVRNSDSLRPKTVGPCQDRLLGVGLREFSSPFSWGRQNDSWVQAEVMNEFRLPKQK